ncbi:MAG TPA: pitrilysin family protein [bacterium]|nr:pitrilysin family protein [bacterium]
MFKFSDYNVKFKSKILENGTKVVVFEKPNAPIAISTVFFSGSIFDPPQKEGTAHFLEHMLTSGTKRFPTKDKIASYIEEVGGVNGASVGGQVFEIYTDIADAEDLDRCFEILEEELFYSLFDDATLEKERRAIMNELDEREASPGFNFYRGNAQLLFKDTNFARTTLQTSETVRNITKEDLLKYKKSMICANRMAIVASGGVSFEEIEKLVKKHLYLQKGTDVALEKVSKKREIFETRIPFEPLKEQVEFALSFRVDIPFLHKDSYALRILDSVLGDGRTSLLTKKLRYERGLVYSVETGHSSFINAGVFYVSGSTNKKDLEEALDVINDTLSNVKRNLITAEELEFSKKRIIKSAKRKMQTTRSWVNTQVYTSLCNTFLEGFTEGMEDTLEDYFKELMLVDFEDIKAVLDKYFTKDNWYFCLMGNNLDSVNYRKEWLD